MVLYGTIVQIRGLRSRVRVIVTVCLPQVDGLRSESQYIVELSAQMADWVLVLASKSTGASEPTSHPPSPPPMKHEIQQYSPSNIYLSIQFTIIKAGLALIFTDSYTPWHAAMPLVHLARF